MKDEDEQGLCDVLLLAPGLKVCPHYLQERLVKNKNKVLFKALSPRLLQRIFSVSAE